MAVVTTYGDGYRAAASPTGSQAFPGVPAVKAEAHQKCIVSSVPVANGDSATSIYYVGRIPSDAILDPSSLVYATGIAGLTSMSVGLGASPAPASPLGGWAASPALFVNAQDWHTAASFSLTGNVSTANANKRMWELLGLTQDPGGFIDVIATVNQAAGAAGTLQFFLKYLSNR
jgi:hypothetical protein